MPSSLSDFFYCICCCIPLSSRSIYETEYNETKLSMFIKAKTRFSRTFNFNSTSPQSNSGTSNSKPKIRASRSPKTLAAYMKGRGNIPSFYGAPLESIPSMDATPTRNRSVTFQEDIRPKIQGSRFSKKPNPE